jgi:hypothetical protein
MFTIMGLRRHKAFALTLIVAILCWTSPAALAWEVTSGPLASLAEAEKAVYGREEVGALLTRVERLEQDLFGSVQSGALVSRLDKIKNTMIAPVGEGSILAAINSLEWYVSRTVSAEPLSKRVTDLESLVLGQLQTGALGTRVDNMLKMTWPEGAFKTSAVKLPKATLIKIRLLTELNSVSSKVGDPVNFRVVQDVVVDGKLVIPTGVSGTGKVSEVNTAGNLGRDGRVTVNFGSIQAVDGRLVSVEVNENATEMNKSLQVAAGASMAGVVLLGPVGLVGGLFVKGKNAIVPVGTEFFIEVSNAIDLTGVQLKG